MDRARNSWTVAATRPAAGSMPYFRFSDPSAGLSALFSNRNTGKIESSVTPTKQTEATNSNRN
jgi:hypothetical protein